MNIDIRDTNWDDIIQEIKHVKVFLNPSLLMFDTMTTFTYCKVIKKTKSKQPRMVRVVVR
jgi:hypothetical protein